MNIAFIGGGNMATALISGLLEAARGRVAIRVADPSEEARERLRREPGVETFAEGRDTVPEADVIVLAVKPQVMPDVLAELDGVIERGQLVVSVAAGTTVAVIQQVLGDDQPVVRAMPNTPALIGHGITGLFASRACRPHHREQAQRILAAVGQVLWVEDEVLMDVVTAVSGSGPAYYFLLTEALAAAGERLGLDGADAARLAVHTAAGAGVMLIEAEEGPAQLRRRVTSLGGTTEAAVEALERGGFRGLINDAVEAATRRGRELAE